MAMQGGTQDRSTIILVLGIVGLVCGCVPAGIGAWIMGARELKAIQAGEASEEGRSKAQIGMYLGIAGTVLSIIGGIVWFMLIGLALLTGGG
jgi:hypothetical protein